VSFDAPRLQFELTDVVVGVGVAPAWSDEVICKLVTPPPSLEEQRQLTEVYLKIVIAHPPPQYSAEFPVQLVAQTESESLDPVEAIAAAHQHCLNEKKRAGQVESKGRKKGIREGEDRSSPPIQLPAQRKRSL